MLKADISPTHSSRRTNAWGIDLAYEDALGQEHKATQETICAVIAAMELDPERPAPTPDDSVIVIRQGDQSHVSSPGVIELESGGTLPVSGPLPSDTPLGYHRLRLDNSAKTATLIVAPEKCWLPETLRTWGWAVQLYAARSSESWGIGDFADLERLVNWSARELNAGMMLVNPLSAATPVTPQQDSPYFPSSRVFLNMLSLHIEWIPGANKETIPRFSEMVEAGRALNSERRIDRNAVFRLKMQALETLWDRFQGDEAFDEFCTQRGESLRRFATFCVLAEHHQSGWRTWAARYRHPNSPDVAEFARANEKRIQFFEWIQWLLDIQLSRCSDRLALMQDLPIGVDPSGADAWIWQDVLSSKAGVGAPPDEFNTQGQNWGLPPYIPHKLRAVAYQPFIETIRAALRHGGGLRIDHVMGLFRLFWIPQGKSAADGAYVRYNADEMLAIVALESHRAKAYVVGEDLGTVEESVRQNLAAHRILSYRLLWFEKEHPREFPREALAAVTTHDLPTVSGLWTGSDIERQRSIGLKPNEEGTRQIHERLQRMCHLESDSSKSQAVESAYHLLAKAPSRILTAALDDSALVEERPNIPATNADQSPNWSIALPIDLESLMKSKLPVRIAKSLRRETLSPGASSGDRDKQE